VIVVPHARVRRAGATSREAENRIRGAKLALPRGLARRKEAWGRAEAGLRRGGRACCCQGERLKPAGGIARWVLPPVGGAGEPGGRSTWRAIAASREAGRAWFARARVWSVNLDKRRGVCPGGVPERGAT